jgi:plasmid stabilization system protein ParE
MDLLWSPAAAQDFSLIIEYIRRDSPQAAERVAKSIYEGAALDCLELHAIRIDSERK